MKKVKGINVVVFIDDGGTDKLYACARSSTLNYVTEFIETSVSGSGNFATYLPTKDSFTGTLEGVTSLEEPGMLTIADLMVRQLNHDLLTMKFQSTNDDGDVYTITAQFYIASSSYTGSFDDMSHFTIELIGTGALSES